MKTAYQKLCDEKEKNVVIINIEHITEEVMKERKRLLNKGVRQFTVYMYVYVYRYNCFYDTYFQTCKLLEEL